MHVTTMSIRMITSPSCLRNRQRQSISWWMLAFLRPVTYDRHNRAPEENNNNNCTFSRSSGEGGDSPTTRLNAASLRPGWRFTDVDCVCDWDCVCRLTGCACDCGACGCVSWLAAESTAALDEAWFFSCSATLAQLTTQSSTRTN